MRPKSARKKREGSRHSGLDKVCGLPDDQLTTSRVANLCLFRPSAEWLWATQPGWLEMGHFLGFFSPLSKANWNALSNLEIGY